jgi:hypothetical protein
LLGNATLNPEGIVIEKLLIDLEVALCINKNTGVTIKAIFTSFTTRFA